MENDRTLIVINLIIKKCYTKDKVIENQGIDNNKLMV